MAIAVIPFLAEAHLVGALEVLKRVRAADPTYPPPRDVAEDTESFSSWLMENRGLARWVAVENGDVAGHVMLTEPHDYLDGPIGLGRTEASRSGATVEISKLFVDPLHQRGGIGEALLATARAFAWANGLQPCLAVVTSSCDAIRLYERTGMRRRGSFSGVHGENLVFIDETGGPPTT